MIQSTVTETLPAIFAQPSADNEEFLGALIRDRFALFERFQQFIPLVVQELAIDEELRQELLSQFLVPMLDQIGLMINQRMQTGSIRPLSPRVILPGVAWGSSSNVFWRIRLFHAYDS